MDIFQIIDACGSIATAVAVVIALAPYRTRLKVNGEFPIRKTSIYVLNLVNPRNRDNEIKSITFYKGNPRKVDSHLFYSVDFRDDEYKGHINMITNNIVVPRDMSVDLPVPCKRIVCSYETIGEALGKPFDTIFVVVKDVRGHRYYINTHQNIDFFRNINR